MLQDRDLNISDFIRFTPGGLSIADFDQVRSALIRRYKSIYGSDIDLANTTADGLFVNDLALIINNILQSFGTLYSNLNVNTASGIYLDTLCALSNIKRKGQTPSVAYLTISLDAESANDNLDNGSLFVDETGNEWMYEGDTIQIIAGDPAISIKVVCQTNGPIIAPAHSIYQMIDATKNFLIDQPEDAIKGRDIETDAELRARRAQSNGAGGITVLESIVGDILDITGIDDCLILNANSGAISAADNITIPHHNIYVVVRRNPSIQVEDQMIGEILYNKLTPGISTTDATGCTSGTAKEYEIRSSYSVRYLDQTVYWKEASPIHPAGLTVTITKGKFFSNDSINYIGEKILKYINGIQLGNAVTENDLIITATYADPKFNGTSTYIVKEVTVPTLPGVDDQNPLTYFDYDKYTYETHEDDPNIPVGDIIITFSKQGA